MFPLHGVLGRQETLFLTVIFSWWATPGLILPLPYELAKAAHIFNCDKERRSMIKKTYNESHQLVDKLI